MAHYDIQKDISLITESNPQYFGNPNTVMQLDFQSYSFEQKEQFAQERLKPNAPYYKLKQMMDYWCSLWFWDVRDAEHLPTREEWYTDLEQLLNIDLTEITNQETLGEETVRDYRKDKKQLEKQLAEALKQSTSSLFTNKRSTLVQRYAKQYKFFHYELEFIEVFREQNGFDLAVGNPPWLKWKFEELDMMGELYPELIIRSDIKALHASRFRKNYLEINSNKNEYFNELIADSSTGNFLNGIQNYPLLKGIQTNLYTSVLENSFSWINHSGFIGLVHPDSVFTDPKGYTIRKEIYKRLKFHFHFKNSMLLFQEVKDQKQYSINIYKGSKNEFIEFDAICHLLHPSTIDDCYVSTLNELPLMQRNLDGKLHWDIRGSRKRIIKYNNEKFNLIKELFDEDADFDNAKLPLLYAESQIDILNKLNRNKSKLSDLTTLKITVGFDETIDADKERIIKGVYKRDSIQNFIYSGPHIFTATTNYKSPRAVSNNKAEYDTINPNLISEDYLPLSLYQLNSVLNDEENNWNNAVKIGFRKMLNQTADRTLNGSILPPGSMHINGLISVYANDVNAILNFGAISSSILLDFYIKIIGKNNLNKSTLENLPLKVDDEFMPFILKRFLMLVCSTSHFAKIWKEINLDLFSDDNWSIADSRLNEFVNDNRDWNFDKFRLNDYTRRQASIEIDVLTARGFGLKISDLIDVYNIQFRVLKKNEDDTWYDAKGKIVFTVNAGLVGVGLDRPDWNIIKDMSAGEAYEHTITKSELYQGEKIIYHAPFTKQDRVEDYKRAWVHFEDKFNKE